MQKSTFSFPVRFALAGLVWTLALAGALVACSRTDDAAKPSDAPTSAAIPANAYDLVAKQGRGFTVGALMSANPVYVLFDPQCPHCGHLWQQSQALHKKVKFVWIPTSFGKPQSLPQGVTLLAAANPLEAMNEHEISLLAGKGGISASATLPPELEQAVKNNTALLNQLRADSVPFIVAKHPQTGASITRSGALDTAALSAFLGLQ